MRKRYLLGLLLLCLFTACNNSTEKKNKVDSIPVSVNDANYKIKMDFASPPWSNGADSLFFHFRIIDPNSETNDKKVFWKNLKGGNVEVRETGGNPPNRTIILKEIDKNNIVDKSGKRTGLISQNVVFWLMVDRSKTILPKDMESMKEAIRETVNNLPDSSVFISFFDKEISERILITKSRFNEIEAEFSKTENTKNLYQSIYETFENFVKDKDPQKKDAAKYLLVFTDGKIDENSLADVLEVTQWPDRIKEIDRKSKNQVQIHAFRYGDDLSADQPLTSICKTHREPDLKGGLYSSQNVAGVITSLRGFVDDLSADYELVLLNHPDKIYNGTRLTLQVIITNAVGEEAVGEIQYTAGGTKENPIGPGVKSDDIYFAILFGFIILIVAFFIMQVGIPYVIYRVTNFDKKYVKPYQPSIHEGEEIIEHCPHCSYPLEKGELIVVKCSHKMHKDCWQENGHKCVEYGQNCKDGIQAYFDKNQAVDLKKSPYYLKWAMSGLISGFIVWIIFYLTSKLGLFSGFIDTLLNTFYPDRLKEKIAEGIYQIPSIVNTNFHSKIGGLLLVGILLGFTLTFLFSYINEFRQKKGEVLLSIFVRALIGAIVGFSSFLIGSIICISLGIYYNEAWVDAIPWLLFGGSIAFCLSYKTTIKNRDALIGGLISGIVSFFILYTTYILPTFGVMFSFMLCSAGLGISIIAKHHTAQRYFLKYKAEKRAGEIAIHKWMNESGGSNEVTIGKSNHCVIQMNWDKSDKIKDKQVKLYIDPKRKIPMLKILEDGMIYDGREGRKEALYNLKHGTRFKIGDTEFEYIEK